LLLAGQAADKGVAGERSIFGLSGRVLRGRINLGPTLVRPKSVLCGHYNV